MLTSEQARGQDGVLSVQKLMMITEKERLLEALKSKNRSFTVIIGLSKNAGKSTFLNWLLEKPILHSTGIITTGRDGEDYDESIHINRGRQFAKPKIFIPAGTLFSTVKDIVRQESSALTILEKLSCKAAGKELWLVRANYDLNTEIVGPPSVKEQVEVAEKMFSYGVQHVLIDGSYDRKAIVSANAAEHIVLAVSPAAGNLTEIKELIDNLKMLMEIRQIDKEGLALPPDRLALLSQKNKRPSILDYERLLGNEKEVGSLLSRDKDIASLYLPTGFTEKSYSLLKSYIKDRKIDIIVTHPLNITLKNSSLKQLLPQLSVTRKFHIDAIAVNSFSADGGHIDCDLIRSSVREMISVPVIDVMEA